jgi:hypothetical protein
MIERRPYIDSFRTLLAVKDSNAKYLHSADWDVDPVYNGIKN